MQPSLSHRSRLFALWKQYIDYYGYCFCHVLSQYFQHTNETARGANGWLYTNENGGWENSAFLIVASIGQAPLGNGALSFRSVPGRNRSEVSTVGATA